MAQGDKNRCGPQENTTGWCRVGTPERCWKNVAIKTANAEWENDPLLRLATRSTTSRRDLNRPNQSKSAAEAAD